MKRWQLKRSKIDIAAMAADLHIQPATAAVLANRNLFSSQKAHAFLSPNPSAFYDALEMKGMEQALDLVTKAIKKCMKIVVYGDYDVDGVMSTCILIHALRHCGADVQYYIPHRQKEGYGLNANAVLHLAEEGTGLLFTCDNGIAALKEISLAKEKGMQVVVLDHHEPAFSVQADESRRDILPQADVVIDPKQQDCTYPFSALCAAGISYKFALLLLHRFGWHNIELEKELLCFAAIATVCDVVDLLEENRALVKLGLQEIANTKNFGLRALLQATQLEGKQITEYHFGFRIGPCINATGRLESAAIAVELFCTKEEARAQEIAQTLVRFNEERKSLTEEAVKRLMAQAEKMQDTQKVFVLYDPDLHESIAGIVAGRIKDKYYHPTILITQSEDGAKGSARSIEGYHIFEALFACRELFTRFGGHAMAAGLSLPKENIAILRERLNQDCTLTAKEMTPVLRIEKILSFAEIHLTLAKQLRCLAPFGKENPSPLFATCHVMVEKIRLVGKEKNIMQMRLLEPDTGYRLAAISFDGLENLREILKNLYPEETCDTMLQQGRLPILLDFVYSIDINSYQGRENVQLVIRDFRVSQEGGNHT